MHDDIYNLAKIFADDSDCNVDVELLHEFGLEVSIYMLRMFQTAIDYLLTPRSNRKLSEGLQELKGRMIRIMRDDDKSFGRAVQNH